MHMEWKPHREANTMDVCVLISGNYSATVSEITPSIMDCTLGTHSPNSCVEVPTPGDIVSRGGAFGEVIRGR